MKKMCLIITLAFLNVTGVFAQLENPVSWLYAAKRINKTEAILYFKANIKDRWHIYSLNVKGIPAKTIFTFMPSKDFIVVGKTLEPKPISHYDKILKTDLTYFVDGVVFQQKIKLTKNATIVKGKVEFMACSDKQCLPSTEVMFSIPVK